MHGDEDQNNHQERGSQQHQDDGGDAHQDQVLACLPPSSAGSVPLFN